MATHGRLANPSKTVMLALKPGSFRRPQNFSSLARGPRVAHPCTTVVLPLLCFPEFPTAYESFVPYLPGIENGKCSFDLKD